MPLVLVGIGVGALIAAALAAGPRAGKQAIATLSDDVRIKVVFDGSLWRPMGSEDFALVTAWSATGAKMADIDGSPKTWNGIGFA